jgi:class 3 adenylate cyclase
VHEQQKNGDEESLRAKLDRAYDREAATREILAVISQSGDDEQPVFEAILNSATNLCHAPLAFLSLVDETETYLSIPAHKGARPKMQKAFVGLRHSIAESEIVSAHVVREKSIIRIDDMASDPKFDRSDPHRALLIDVEGVRSYLVVPLLRGDICLGTLNLYRREVDPFSDDDVLLAETFARQALIAIDNVRQFRALQDRTADVEALNADLESRVVAQVDEIERMGRLKRFLPAAVADTIVTPGSEKLLASHRTLLGVLFCDIRGFTAFCETAEPEETIEVLQTYHEEMGLLIAEHGAGVDTRAGDGIMVLFNDPLPCEDPASDALRLGLAMRSRMVELCKIWRRHGHKLGFGVGISLGYATVGMVGSAGRYDYTASGTAVNLAARLCDKAADGEILLSPRA